MTTGFSRPSLAPGYSLIECVIGLAFVASASAVVAPMAASVVDAARARQAAGFMAAQFRLARQQAARTGAAEALVFDDSAGAWTFRVCRDGNGNGVRRSELGGIDPCQGGLVRLSTLFPAVTIACDPSVPDPGGVAGSTDPVRFGASNIASFSPLGSGTAGTLYLMSAEGARYAVRVAGVTGRTRVLRFERSTGRWVES
jgi:type II secretory pathway pseudopilin PulG